MASNGSYKVPNNTRVIMYHSTGGTGTSRPVRNVKCDPRPPETDLPSGLGVEYVHTPARGKISEPVFTLPYLRGDQPRNVLKTLGC